MKTKTVSPVEALRHAIIGYVANQYGGQAVGFAAELDISHSMVSRYLHAKRPMSGSFITLVRTKVPQLAERCTAALSSLTNAKYGTKGESDAP